MELGRTVAEKTFEIRDSKLFVGGVPASEAVRQFGSPVYLYDLDVLKRTYNKLRNGLRDDVRLFYSLKANPSLCIGAAFRELGAGAEIASTGELETALKAEFAPDNIIFAGPGKQEHELEASVRNGLLSINVESTDELKTIGRIAEESGRKAFVSLRINPKDNVSGSQMQMGGGPSPFGLDEERIPEALSVLDAQKHLVFQGIHVYVGNQILDAKLAVTNIENTLNIARKVASERPTGSMKLVNLGGGLGIPYYKHQREFDIEGFVRELNCSIESIKKEPPFRDTTFILELGRYLVAPVRGFFDKGALCQGIERQAVRRDRRRHERRQPRHRQFGSKDTAQLPHVPGRQDGRAFRSIVRYRRSALHADGPVRAGFQGSGPETGGRSVRPAGGGVRPYGESGSFFKSSRMPGSGRVGRTVAARPGTGNHRCRAEKAIRIS